MAVAMGVPMRVAMGVAVAVEEEGVVSAGGGGVGARGFAFG